MKICHRIKSTTTNFIIVNTISMAFSVSIGPGTNVGTVCSLDWITIPCATNTMDVTMQVTTAGMTAVANTCVDRICGMTFNSVTSTATIASTVNSKLEKK